MRWLRSWPLPMPPHRAYVVDELERLHTVDYDYTPLGLWFAEHPEEHGVCVIEWDIALEPSQFAQFAGMAEITPDKPLVAPQLLHHVEGGAVWAHRRINRDGNERWLRLYETPADYVAFGLIYFPARVVQAFLAAKAPERGAPLLTPGGYTDSRFCDQTFSMWYRHRYSEGGTIKVEWSIQPVHLHGRGV